MCIPPFVIYMLLGTLSGFFIILAIFYSQHLLHLSIAFLLSIIQSRIKCPNCSKPILQAPNGWYLFTIRPTCRHCGFDTMRCDKP